MSDRYWRNRTVILYIALLANLTMGAALAQEAVLTEDDSTAAATSPPAAPPEVMPGLAPLVTDIAFAPDGRLLVTQNATVRALDDDRAEDLTTIPTVEGSPAHGIVALDDGSLLVASGGLDLAVGAGVWRVANGEVSLWANIEVFEKANDPDANSGNRWKDPRCEVTEEFSEGPQSNPYGVALLEDDGALVADAAGNTLLHAGTDGTLRLAAVFDPPPGPDGEPLVLFTLEDGTDCYVQPVPTAVAIGADGAAYIGELTGAVAEGTEATGHSRIWRLEPDARDTTCPSEACKVAFAGLTSVVDLAFAPDGRLWVVEMDANGWLAATSGDAAGGRVLSCDVATGECMTVAQELSLPGALAFDETGTPWLLENGPVAPTVRAMEP